MASQAGSAMPCSRPAVSRTASASRLTQGMPSSSAPSRPASLSTARSTETVVCVRASSTIGCPARRASSRAWRTMAGSRPSLVVTVLPASIAVLPWFLLPAWLLVWFLLRAWLLVDPAVEQGAHAGLGPDQVQRQLRVAGHVPVADQHGHVRGHALGA